MAAEAACVHGHVGLSKAVLIDVGMFLIAEGSRMRVGCARLRASMCSLACLYVLECARLRAGVLWSVLACMLESARLRA